MKLDESYVAAIVKYRGIIKLFLDFFAAMRRNTKKDTRFPRTKLIRLLKEVNFL